MRLVRKLALLTTMALAAMALAASSASAQEEIEVTEEGGGHCNPCVVHAVSTQNVQLDVHIFGIEFTDSVCANEFDAVIYEDATGALTNQSLTGAGCNREPCAATPWPITGRETVAGAEILEATFCVQPVGGGDPINCSIDVGVEDEAGHILGFHAVDARCHRVGQSPAEVSGEWVTESGDGREEVIITH
jgi:hypothetical protein